MTRSIFLSPQSRNRFGPSGKPTFVESGDRDLDYAMAQTLSMLTDTWKVLPAFAYYDDSTEPNAAATAKRWFSRADGTVIFGRTLLGILLRDTEQPDVAISIGGCARVRPHCPAQIQADSPDPDRTEDPEAAGAARRLSGRLLCRRAKAGEAQTFRPRSMPRRCPARRRQSLATRWITTASRQERAQAIVAGFQTSFRDRRRPVKRCRSV